MSSELKSSLCPIGNKEFSVEDIENHVDKCLFLNSECETALKRQYQDDTTKSPLLLNKKPKNKSGSSQASTSSFENDSSDVCIVYLSLTALIFMFGME